MLMFSLLQCHSSKKGTFITSFDLALPEHFFFLFMLHVLLENWKICKISYMNQQDIEDLDHYEMKEEEPVDGKKSEDDGIEKENLAILEKIRKNQRQDHLNVSLNSVHACLGA